jgi:hydrogenase maturation protease
MRSSILLLALGNDIMGDDAVGLVAANSLEEEFGKKIDFINSIQTGLSLLETMSGYEQVLLLDSIVTGRHRPGTILEFSACDFETVLGSSPHFMGLPEIIELADRLSIDFPQDIRILALEIEQPFEFSANLSRDIRLALPEYVHKAGCLLHQWF